MGLYTFPTNLSTGLPNKPAIFKYPQIKALSLNTDLTSKRLVKKVKDLFKELGFNKEAPLSTQKAFLKNLTDDFSNKKLTRRKPRSTVDQQLTFPELEVQIRKNKQVS